MPPPSTARASATPPRSRGLLLGASAVLGWVLHDQLVFSSFGWPSDGLALLPWAAGAVVLGAVAGALLGGRRALLVVAMAATALWLLWSETRSGLPRARALLPWAALGLLLAGTLGGLAQRLAGLSGPRVALALGVLGSLLLARSARAVDDGSWWLLGAAAGAVALARLGPAPWGRPAASLLFLAPLWWIGARVLDYTALPRPDLPPPVAEASPEAPNVLLVVLDTVRADHLASYGHERETTPWLDRWAAERATRYTRARSTSSWTLPSHASLFTGLVPSEHGVTHPRTDPTPILRHGLVAPPLAPEVVTLAERFRDAGYRTGAVLANASTLRVEYGLTQGYEHYDVRRANFVRDHLALAQMVGAPLWIGHKPYRDARVTTDLALGWLERPGVGEDPWFLTLNYMDAHLPYLPPGRFGRALAGAVPRDPLDPERELLALQYDRELCFLDAELERLFTTLEARGDLEDAVVVVTSDHGEAFGEHGAWGHDWFLYDELVRVPLFVVPRGGRRAAVDDTPISGTGVHDLLLCEAGLAPAEEPPVDPLLAEWFHGSFLPLHADPPRTREGLARDLYAWVESDRKWIVGSRGEVEVFDLARDPAERSPLATTEEERAAALERARAHWAAHPPPVLDAAAGDPIEDELQRLRSLGYLGEESP